MSAADAATRRGHLPSTPTPFIGRADEQAAVLARLRDPVCRLLTIVGPGGAGKTRLALEVARALVPGAAGSPFADGVYFVPLATLSAGDARQDTPANVLAEVLGLVLSGPESAITQVRNYLREKSLLLVFDNFEHLLAATDRLRELLEAAPAVKLLVTSRARLNLRGEWLVELGGLPFPTSPQCSIAELEQYDAIRLFLQAARADGSEFRLTADNAPAVARIAQLVAGLPLGIELAAGCIHALSCEEIASAIQQRLDLPDANILARPDRQRGLRAVFESSWSLSLLGASEQEALRRLAVFEGSFTREAAEIILHSDASETSS
jgi:predicted ATPase